MKKQSSVLSNGGFSIIQVLVISGIMIVLFAGLTSLSLAQNKNQKKMAMKFELQDFRNTLAQALAVPATCRQILTSITTPIDEIVPGELSSISLVGNKKIWDSNVGKPEGSTSGLSIKSIKFISDGLVVGTTDRFIGHLEITPLWDANTLPIAPEVLRQIVVVDENKRIIDCISTTIPSCPIGQIYSGINSSGLPNCISLQCPAGKVISGVSALGTPTCVDETQITLKTWSCPVGQAARSISSNGVPECVSITAATPTTPTNSNNQTQNPAPATSNTQSNTTKSPCTGGIFKEPSADNSNNCEWNVPDAQPGVSLGRISGSSGSWVDAICSSSGSGKWDYTYHCPSAKGAFSCSGGGHTITSPDGKNTCDFNWPDTNAGRTVNLSSVTGGTGTATCSDPSGWSFTYSCPNASGTPTCPAGGVPNYPSTSSKTLCAFSWSQVNVGTRVNLTSSQGEGRATAFCKAENEWVLEKIECK